tara:strand:- start:704 stop:2065 length:1362 start_codon:yes stop_codon:yes gene_type:complete
MHFIFSLIFFSFFFTNLALHADDWPGYLGPTRNTVWNETGVTIDFEKNPPKLLWSQAIGGGYSGPSVSGNRVYVMDREAEPYKPEKIKPGTNLNFVRAKIPGKERVLCLDTKNGEVVWAHEYKASYSSVFIYAIGPRTTPLVHDDHVFTLGAEGHLHAYQAKGGKLVWSKNLIIDFGIENPEWGTACHPIIYKKNIICTVGGKGQTLIAFDYKTGKEKWRCLSSTKPGYGTPVIETINGTNQLIVWHGESVNSVNPENGELYWSVDFKPEFGMAIGAPRIWNDLIYVMGYNGKSGTIRVSKDSKSAELLWGLDRRLGVAGVLNTAHVKDGYIYSGGQRGVFRCIEISTGKRLWENKTPLLKKDGSGRGAWPSAFTVYHKPSGHNLIFNDHGEMISAKLNPQGYEEKSRTQIIEPTHSVGGRMLVWSHPALANKKLFCRNDKEIRCYNLATSNE